VVVVEEDITSNIADFFNATDKGLHFIMPLDPALELIMEVGLATGNVIFALRFVLNSPISL
jgi:hypothetical protein